MRRILMAFVVCFMVWIPVLATGGEEGVPILLYHRFGPVVADSMTVTTPVFESHLKYLHENGYKVIPLRELLACISAAASLPVRALWCWSPTTPHFGLHGGSAAA